MNHLPNSTLSKTLAWLILTSSLCLVFTGCATLFSSSVYNVSVRSEPTDAKVKVKNKAGQTVYSGRTPAQVALEASSSYIQKERYQVIFPEYDHQELVTAEIDPWYVGNILFPGIFGFLLFDPISGAMYQIDKSYVNSQLKKPSEEQDSPEKQPDESSQFNDAIYLKDGSIIYGDIIKVKPGEKVKIKTTNGNVLVYEMKQVKSIEKKSAED